MTYKDFCDIFPRESRVICSTVEQRRKVTEIAVESGMALSESGYGKRVLDGTADSIYMHPYHTWSIRSGDYLTFNRAEPFLYKTDITYEEFMSFVSNTDVEFECGEIESLLGVSE